MEHHTLSVGPGDEGIRVDRYLAANLPHALSRAAVQRMIKEGGVLIFGKPVKASHLLKANEALDISIPDPKTIAVDPEKIPLAIVHEDDDLIVVDKAAGMVVHPAPGNYSGTLVNALLGHCGHLASVGSPLRPGIVHRIDKGTSGLLVVAKTDEAYRFLSRQFRDRETERRYAAIVDGVVRFDNGSVELPIGRSASDRMKMDVTFENSKEALTTYHVLERFGMFTLLDLKLFTGRTHQIRVHLAHIGYPIVGDITYGKDVLLGRPALHARTLGFVHPKSRRAMKFSSPIPDDMVRFIREHGGKRT